MSKLESSSGARSGGPSSVTRRQFLRCASAGAGLVAMPSLIPSSALGLDEQVAPSERIVLGGIGIGRRGSGVLNWMMGEKDIQFVAVCDPQKSRREKVKKMVDERYGNQ
ncbi:MAG TPA: gfo/Idh/MocA family oxidoreductase, partial [Thermoguttaceae bacterium]|nr:gfo/Idh/MocA family oxidoreductase [Thermoguttaceae bacterium]